MALKPGMLFSAFAVEYSLGDAMPEQSIRFVVSNKNNQRAATWKCWTSSNSSDVYIACREIGSALKASLHESHQWHLAYFEDFYQRSIPADKKTEQGRFIQKWPRPPEIAPGFTLALQIYTPSTSVSSPLDKPSKFVHIPAPDEGAAVEISVFLLTGDAINCECPGATTMGTKPVGSMKLVNGDVVSIVYRECAIPDMSFGPVTAHLFNGVEKDSIQDANSRMLVLGDRPDGSRCLFDSVGTYERDDT